MEKMKENEREKGEKKRLENVLDEVTLFPTFKREKKE